MLVAGLDQDYAAMVDWYDGLLPEERGELSEWIVRGGTEVGEAPEWIRNAITTFAGVAFLDIAHRWSNRDN